VTTNQLRNWINEEVLCQQKVGVSVIDNGKDHEKEVSSTNPNKGENGVWINKGSGDQDFQGKAHEFVINNVLLGDSYGPVCCCLAFNNVIMYDWWFVCTCFVFLIINIVLCMTIDSGCLNI